jgi:septal ring factor EnvC (AmiA/AmiB activator)
MKVSMEDVKNFSSNKMTLLIIMLCLVFSLQVFTLFDNGSEVKKINYIKKEISALKDEVDSIRKSEKALDKKIDSFNIRIAQIHEAVKVNNIKIDNLKKYEKIQIDNFKSYDALMWERYFADRYSK